jgi:hypothetical protein
MPLKSKHPRLRSHVRKGRGGQAWVYYFYDMRPDGEKDVPLGKDYREALRLWDEIHNKKPASKGRIREATERWRNEILPTYKATTRTGYAKQLRHIEDAFGKATWAEVDFAVLCQYLDMRTGKTQANRELAVLKLVWDKANRWRMTMLPWPALGKGKWKNPEGPRAIEVTDLLFDAIYAKADQTLRDTMDIASATGMRLTDVRTVLLPIDDTLHLKASKTGKKADFDLSLSAVLPDLIARRRAVSARHLMLLSTPSGAVVTQRMLRTRWDDAREAAAKEAEKSGNSDFAGELRGLYLRDLRKYASDIPETLAEAAELLQHSDSRLTRKHYRSKVTKLKTVR